MTVLGNLAAYLTLLTFISWQSRNAALDARLIQAYREWASAQEERHRAMCALVTALRQENALLKKEKALSAHAAKHRE